MPRSRDIEFAHGRHYLDRADGYKSMTYLSVRCVKLGNGLTTAVIARSEQAPGRYE